jgi:Plant transposon protein
MEQQRKRSREQLEEQLLESLEADCLVHRDENSDPIPHKKRRASRFCWEQARLAIQQNFYGPNPVFDDRQFARFFRIRKEMADELLAYLANQDPWFAETSVGVAHCRGIDPKAKLLLLLKILGHGASSYAFIDMFQMGEATAAKTVKKFCCLVRTSDELRSRFLRAMTRADARRVSDLHYNCYRVEGMIGSFDCMHAYWKNCPMAYWPVYAGKEGKASLVLEAVADHNLFFWHAAFGFPGTHNDINILDQSPLWKSMLDGSFHRDFDFHFWINGQRFVNLFLLADGIYLSSGRFCKTFTQPIGEEKKKYAVWQEATRKDIERAFGVLQRKFQIMKKLIEQWFIEDICDMMYTCLILHNWMVTDRVSQNEEEHEDLYEAVDPAAAINQPEDDQESDAELDGMWADDAHFERLEQRLDAALNHETPAMIAARTRLEARKKMYKLVLTKKAHYRFARLYDENEHKRLREAIIAVVGLSK